MFGSDINLAGEQAKEVVQKVTDNLDPLLQNAENRVERILHGLLNRINGTKVTITIDIPPENPPPREY
jgi:hypothetical protein